MTRIRITYPFMVLAAIFVVADSQNKLIMTLMAMLIHETGHIVGMISKNIPFETITIGITGANIVYGSNKLTSYTDDIFIAAMGSCFNFLAVLIGIAVENVCGYDMNYLIGVNILLGIFNIIPVIPLDGGRIILSILSMIKGPPEGEMIMRRFGVVAATAGVVFGVALIMKQGNFTLLMASIVILIYNI